MLNLKNIQKALHLGQRCPRAGFTLLEIIMVLVLIGIIAAVVGPFLGQVMSNFLEIRQMSERERQAGPALERFVRDVREASNPVLTSSNDCSQEITLGPITYKIENNALTIESSGQDQILARNISSDSEFCEYSIGNNNSYKMYLLDLKVNVNNGEPLEYRAAAVPR